MPTTLQWLDFKQHLQPQLVACHHHLPEYLHQLHQLLSELEPPCPEELLVAGDANDARPPHYLCLHILHSIHVSILPTYIPPTQIAKLDQLLMIQIKHT